jgi:hypothetical protein
MEVEGFWLIKREPSRYETYYVYASQEVAEADRHRGRAYLATTSLNYGRFRVTMVQERDSGGYIAKQTTIFEDYHGDYSMFIADEDRQRFLHKGIRALQFQLEAIAKGWEDEENS